MPSIIPGNPIRSVQATASLGRLISTSKLPASENNDRRFACWMRRPQYHRCEDR